MRGRTFEELGKHFFAIGLVFLTVGLITPLFEGRLRIVNIVGLILWLIFVAMGVYLMERGRNGD